MALSDIFQITLLLSFICVQGGQGYNVLAYWSLNGTEQGLSLHGGPTFVEGRYPGSKAINFNQPSNCFARIPKVELRGRSFTIALWLKVKSLLNRPQVFFGDWYAPWQFFMGITGQGFLQFTRHTTDASWTAFNIYSNFKTKINKWFHIAVTWDQSAGIGKLYIDANEEASKPIDKSKTWQPPRDTYEIGNDGHWNRNQFFGSVMDLYIIEGVLNDEQLKYLKGFLEITSSYLNNTFVYTNETVQCQATGSPTPYVAWVHSGVVLVNKTSSAEITITEKKGEYMCVALNREGTKEVTVKAKAALRLCHDYHTISDVSRAVNHFYQSSQVKTENTDNDLSRWYRIQSPAGNQLPTTCVPQNRCGAHAPGWLNGPHPSIQDGIVKKTVCFHLNGNCCYQNTTVHIKKCYGYYVYKFSGVPKGLPARYCSENKMEDTPDSIFKPSKDGVGYSLVGHVIHAEIDTQNVFACMNYCLLYNSCKSFNYSKEKKICELNNMARSERENCFQKKISFVYYEKINVVTITVH